MTPSRDGGLGDEGTRLEVITAGAMAGLVSRFVIAPLDVAKIRLQLQPGALSYRGALSTLRDLVAHEGVTALWKGNVPAELLYVCYAVVQFSVYRIALHAFRGRPSTEAATATATTTAPPAAWQSLASGAAGGAAATLTTYPLDLLRTRFAAQGPRPAYPTLRRAVVQVWRDEGGRGFYRGLGPALTQIAPYMGILFAMYEALRARLPPSTDAAAGVLAGVAAKTTVFPLDLVRKRMQVQGPTRASYAAGNVPEYRSSAAAVVAIVRADGLRGLYRGLVISLVKAAPASAVTLWTFERTLGLLQRRDARGQGSSKL